MRIFLDFETRSDIAITRGIVNYRHHPSTTPLLLSYAFDDAPPIIEEDFSQPFWPLIDAMRQADTLIYAFNAPFDWSIWNYCLQWPVQARTAWQRYKTVDVKALCARYGMPHSLEKASHTLCGASKQKGQGSSLIKLFQAHSAPQTHPDEWAQFKEYCLQDIVSMRGVVNALPADHLSPEEHSNFILTWDINEMGIPIDVPSANNIVATIESWLEQHKDLIPRLTGGMVERITQVQRIRAWLQTQGLEVEDLTAATVTTLLERTDLPSDVTTLLELRAATGLSSVAKYKRIQELEYKGRIHYNHVYHGAHTGRVTGSGFQMLNLPRAQSKDVDSDLKNFASLPNPILTARSLVRAMIHPEVNHTLVWADYSSIEYVLLAWLVDDQRALRAFTEMRDVYAELAAVLYHKRLVDVAPKERQIGKAAVLGCGYGMGAKRFQSYAEQWGVVLSAVQAEGVVGAYRQQYSKVQKAWYECQRTVIQAVLQPDTPFKAYGTTWHVHKKWLKMSLPSGRNMYYWQPRVVEEMGRLSVHVKRVNRLTYQLEDAVITPGTWVENIVQAIARDLLYWGMKQAQRRGHIIIGSVYDEVITQVKNKYLRENTLELLISAMCTKPEWLTGLCPVRATGYVDTRYHK